MWETIQGALENQFLSGGAILMMFGAVLALMREVPKKIYVFLKRKVLVSVEVTSRSEAYDWLVEWISQHPYSQKSHILTAVAGGSLQHYQRLKRDEHDEVEIPRLVLSPGIGNHLMWHKGRPILVTRSRETNNNSDTGVQFFFEDFKLQTFAIRDGRSAIYDMLDAAAEQAVTNDKRVRIRVPSWDLWQTATSMVPRPMDSIILDEGIAEGLIGDIKAFQGSRTWYGDMGIPYRRGYLLYGPPGNGKTSIVSGISSYFQMDMYIFSLGSSSMSDQRLMHLMLNVPDRSIVLLEDIDSAFEDRENKSRNSELSFSGLLNAIDGASASAGRLLFLTTNHRERLDPALVRPGRIDYEVYIGDAMGSQVVRMFERFFPGLPIHQIEDAEDAIMTSSQSISMAALQNYLIKHREDPKGAVENIQLLTDPESAKHNGYHQMVAMPTGDWTTKEENRP